MKPLKYFLKKEFFFVIIFIVMTITSINSYSQCYNNFVGGISPTTSWQTTGSYGSMPYWSFTGYAGATYNFSNCNGTAEDTYMRVFDASMNQLAYNDDNGPYCSTSNSSLDWACTSTATYYVSITHYSCSYLSYAQPLTYKATNLPNPEMTVPATGNNSYTTCSGHLYDNGGSAANYGSGQDGYTVIYPGNSSQGVQLTGSYTTESGYEHIYIYDGVGTGGTVLYNGGSGTGTIGTITSSGNNVPLTVRFTSDGSVEYSGLDFSISCVTLCTPAGTAWTAGSNSWYASVFDGSAGNWDYRGYYTEGNLSWNSLDRWGSGDTPSNASGYQGCAVGVENHRTSYSRRGFPCGKYNLSSPNHDDDFYVYIDVNGDGTWDWSSSWGCCSALGTFWTGWLNSNSIIRVDCIEYGGGSNSSLTLSDITPAPNTNLQLNGTSGGITVCAGQTITVTQSDINPSDETVYYYWGTENPAGSGWSTWDICANCQINVPSFNVSFASPGRYIMHTNAYNPCGTYTTYGGNTYVITVVAPPVAGTVTLSNPNCGSTYVFSLSGNTAAVEDWEYSWNSGASWTSWGQGNVSSVTWGPGGSAGLMVRARIVSGPCVVYTNAVGPTTAPIQTGENMNCPIDLGTISGAGYSYSNTQNNGSFLNDYGQASGDIYYKFTLNATYIVNLSHCGSGFDTYMYLLNSGGTQLFLDDDNGTLCTGTAASLQVTLGAGTYYLVSEGYSSYTGNINTQISLCAVSIDDGSITANGSYGSITVCPGSTVTIASVGGNTGNWCYWIDSGCNSDWDLMAGGNCNQSSFTYTLNTPGCYIFHKRHSDGCGYCWEALHGASCGCSNCTVTVNVSSTALVPPTSVTVNPATICNGGTSQLNAISGGTNITWWNAASGGGSYGTSASGANFPVSPAVTTTYYAESNASTCTSATRVPVTVTVVADPSATITGTTSICEGAIATYSVSGVTGGTGSATYQWYFKSPSGSFAALTDGSSNAPCYISVSGAATAALTLGLYNFASACSGYQVYCIVTYNGNGCNTAASNTITTTVSAPVGNPAVFGNGIWNVYAYSGGNIDLTGTYYGYYTESNLSYNTLDRWCTLCSPSDASGWQGCYVSIDNHVVVSKRTNFTCGYYQLDMPNHDDDVRVYINGNLVFEHIGCCDAHTNIWTGYLTASSTIEVRHLEGGGGSHQSLTITPVGTSFSTAPASISGSTSICSGGSTTLTQVGGNLANGAEYKWYSGSCGGAFVGTGASVTVSPAAPTTYFVRAEGTCNTTACASTDVAITSNVSLSNTFTNENCPADNNGSVNVSLSGGISNVRYIKITQQYPEWTNMADLQAIEAFTGTNLSLAASATASSIHSSGSFPASEFIDGITNDDGNMWHSGSGNAGEWIQVDLGAAKNIDYIRIYNRVGCCWFRSQNLLMQLYNASNVLIFQKNINVYESIDGPHYLDVNVLNLSWSDGGTTFNRTGLDAGTYTLNYSDVSGCSTGSTQAVIGTNNAVSTAPVSITGTTTICSGGTTILSVNGGFLGSGASWKWYSGSCGGTLVGTGNSFTTPVLTSNTDYFVRAEGTCNSTGCAGITVTVNSQPTASAGGSQTICVGNTATVSGASSANGAIAWTENGAGSITSGATTLTPTYNSVAGDAGNTVTLTMTVSNSPCVAATATYTVVVKAQPTASAGGSQTICAGSTATVSGASSSNGTIAWTENGAGSITSGAATLTPTYTPLAGDAGNTVTLTMTVSNNPCSAATATYTVVVTGPSTSVPTTLSDGDYVWTGYSNQFWATPSNWIVYNSGLNNFSVAPAAPLSDKNVFFRAFGSPSCISNAAHLATGTSGSCKNITVETNLSMDATSTLNVSGNWTNNGTFTAGTGMVSFNGAAAQTITSGGNNFNNVVFNNTAAGNSDINITQPMTINGSGTFTNGIVYYSGTGALTFANGTSCNGGSATSFVNGVITKSGSNAFTFPTGEVSGGNLIWAPVGIAAPAASSNITAQYKFDIPHDDGGNIIENYNSWMMCNTSELHHASGIEYWKMTSDNAEPAVTLYWKDASRSQIAYLPDLCVAHFEDCDGPGPGTNIKWANKGADLDPMATLGIGGSGYVTSTIAFNSYSPVTFGTKNSTNPLPISLLRFNAACENNKVDVTWSTATETNNDYFTIQRSVDASNWEFVKSIPGGGNSNSTLYYSATDADPLSGTSYYRLKQTDYNGQSETFSPVAVICGDVQEKQSISYYPNPFTSEVMVDLRNINYEKAVLRIYDLLGEKVYEMILTSNESINREVKIDLHSLPEGVYCAVFSSDGYSNTSKIVKNY